MNERTKERKKTNNERREKNNWRGDGEGNNDVYRTEWINKELIDRMKEQANK